MSYIPELSGAVDKDVCWLRLDFETFTTLGPTATDETDGGLCIDMLTITVIISGPGLYLNPWSRKSSLSSLTNLIKDQELRCNPWILTGYIWPNHSYRLWHLDWTTQ